ncbi:MAG: SDR family NAD(P)-dependent oxidoreductase [Solirubrobacteraceae bacterium]
MDLGLSGRACVVTGASSGIGASVVRALVAEGAGVLGVARGIGNEGGDGGFVPLALDVTAVDAGEWVLAACFEAFGRVDVLVNCAGTSAVRSISELSEGEWQEQWELNVMGPMRLMRSLAPAMAERGWGRIVNVSSSSGKRPSSTNMAYSVTKAAMLSLSRSFADLYASRGVLVNAVTPGPVASEMWLNDGGMADQQAHALRATKEEVLARAASKLPLARFGRPEEIADVIVFLCSERASNVVGSAWSADGGAVPGIL